MFPGGPDNLNIGLLMSEQVSLEKHPNQGLVGNDCLPPCLPRPIVHIGNVHSRLMSVMAAAICTAA